MIPSWLPNGVLPPTLSATGEVRAPYKATPLSLAQRFAESEPRARILDGLFELRRRIRAEGLVEGFQWLNGSFVEHVEAIEQRPPKDVDVVTFVALGGATGPQALFSKAPQLFDSDALRAELSVDHYWVDLNGEARAPFARRVAYWYSMWSHRRDGLWKGFIELDLAATDEEAISALHVGPNGEG